MVELLDTEGDKIAELASSVPFDRTMGRITVVSRDILHHLVVAEHFLVFRLKEHLQQYSWEFAGRVELVGSLLSEL